MFDDRWVERLGVDVFTGAGVENHAVQRAPRLLDLFADLAHGLAVGQVTGDHQHLPGIAQCEHLQGCAFACTDRQVRTGSQQFFGQRGANAVAGARQPIPPWRRATHPVLLSVSQ
ncbi:hypothetical protein D3C76_1324430 [compost metagenome]